MLLPVTDTTLLEMCPLPTPDSECSEFPVFADGTSGGDEGLHVWAFLSLKSTAKVDNTSAASLPHTRPTLMILVWPLLTKKEVPPKETTAIIAAATWVLQSKILTGCEVTILHDVKYAIIMANALYHS